MLRAMILFAACLVSAPAMRADEVEVPLDKVPEAVLKGFKERFKDARPTGASKETADGKTVYEVTFKEGGLNRDVTFSEGGVLMMIEKEIKADKLPRAVSAAAGKKYPGAEYLIAEEVFKVEKKEEKLSYYEVRIRTADKKIIELQITAEGKITATEEKKGDGKD